MDSKKSAKITVDKIETEIKKIKIEVERVKKERDDYKNSYLRALADYRNLEKRILEEKANFTKTANTQLVLKLLPFLDNLEKAEVFIKDQGLKLVKDNLTKVFIELGIEEIQILGKSFDPYLAEAVEVVDGDNDNIVVDVVRKGYKLDDRILRVAQVKVSRRINK